MSNFAVTEEFLNAIRCQVKYCENESGTTKERLEMLAFSILVMLDGHSGSFDGDIVSLAYECEENNKLLHDQFYKKDEF